MTSWQQWVHHPEKSWLRNVFFQLHFWLGVAAGLYIFIISITGSLVVFRNELPPGPRIEWLIKLHTNLLAGEAGRFLNGLGALCLTLLCLTGAVIWWPGIRNWRRSLIVKWSASFPRISWDLHSALGFWSFLFTLIWSISGMYFGLPGLFNVLYVVDRSDRYADLLLLWLARLHFGRFGLLTELLWTTLGLVPAMLAFTGVFICCRRIIFKKASNPNAQPGGGEL